VDRSPGGQLHGLPVRPGWAIQVGKVLRDGIGAVCGLTPGSRRSCLRSSATPNGPSAVVLVLETPHAAHGRGVAAWVGQKAALAPSQLTFVGRADGESRRRCADRRAHFGDGIAQDGQARLRCEQDRERDRYGAPATGREETISGRSVAPTTASCTAARRAIPSRPMTRSWPRLVPKIPASASKDYGTPFYDIFKRYDGDFYKIDPLLFSPAEVWLTRRAEAGRRTTRDI